MTLYYSGFHYFCRQNPAHNVLQTVQFVMIQRPPLDTSEALCNVTLDFSRLQCLAARIVRPRQGANLAALSVLSDPSIPSARYFMNWLPLPSQKTVLPVCVQLIPPLI